MYVTASPSSCASAGLTEIDAAAKARAMSRYERMLTVMMLNLWLLYLADNVFPNEGVAESVEKLIDDRAMKCDRLLKQRDTTCRWCR